MRKLISNILIAVASVLVLFATGCQEPVEVVVSPYLDVVPEEYNATALGEGDAFLLSIRSNVAWELSAVDNSGAPVDWIRFDVASGSGNADVIGFILRGDRETDRTCTIVVSTSEAKLEKRLEMKQGIFVPVILHLDFADVLKAGAPLAAGQSEALTDFGQFKAEVAAVPGENLPDGYIYITDGGRDFVKVKTAQAATLKAGDKVLIEMTDGTVTKDENGGLTANIPAEIVVEASGEPSYAPVFISADAVARYENALVAVGYAQATDANVGKSWGGDIQMTTDQIQGGSTFTVHVASGASFANGSVPASSGQVVGIVQNGKVCPRNAADLAGLTQERKTAYVQPYRIQTTGNFLNATAKATIGNGTVENKTKVNFTEKTDYSHAGASVEKVGGGSSTLAFVANSLPYECCFTTKGWNTAGAYLMYTIPVTQKIYGDLDFNFSISCGNATAFKGITWTVQWSKDKTNWKNVDAVYCTNQSTVAAAKGNTFQLTSTGHQANRQVAEFSIPESEAISSGNIYFKLAPEKKAAANQTLRFNCGFYLCSRTHVTPKYGFDNVLAMETFENNRYGIDPVVGIPVYYLVNHTGAPGYSNAEGWGAAGTSNVFRGCLHLAAASGKNYMISPVLDMLKAPTDITVTFKAAPSWFVDKGVAHTMNNINIGVSVLGSGTVGEIVWDTPLDSAPYDWHTATVKIKGASSDTYVNIGVLEDAATNSRFYIDDIVISR